MQKKLIALAVVGLLSAPAFAQSDVAVYGTIDYGYVSLGSNNASGIKSRNAIDSGISRANRLGFKGEEDLGNGLKAVFVLETGLNGDSGAMWKDTAARQSYAGLASRFGTVAFGRQYTPQHLFTQAVDPFAKNGLGSAGNVLLQDKRLNNLVAYVSPTWRGFSFITGWSWNGTRAHDAYGGGDEPMGNNVEVETIAFAPSFTWNNLFVGFNYHQAKVNRYHISDIEALKSYDLFTSYDFGFVKLGFTVGKRITNDDVFGSTRNIKLTQGMIGATFRLTPNDSILTSYSRAVENKMASGEDRRRIGQWAIGYEHALSKRTVLYAQAAFQQHSSGYKDGGFRSLYTDSRVGSVTSTYGPVDNNVYNAAQQQYRRGLALGFRHDF
jgi:predicted porin